MTNTIIHVGDIGTIFRLTVVDDDGVAIDISTATVKRMYFKKPGGTKLCRSASFLTDGSDGILEYVSVAGDIDLEGRWLVQGYVELPAGKFYTASVRFIVNENLSTECA